MCALGKVLLLVCLLASIGVAFVLFKILSNASKQGEKYNALRAMHQAEENEMYEKSHVDKLEKNLDDLRHRFNSSEQAVRQLRLDLDSQKPKPRLEIKLRGVKEAVIVDLDPNEYGFASAQEQMSALLNSIPHSGYTRKDLHIPYHAIRSLKVIT